MSFKIARRTVRGALTFLPGIGRLLLSQSVRRGTGGTRSARYCYSVWLRHAVMASANGIWKHPKALAELGPGDSIGVGLAALLSGVEKYFAFDIVEYASLQNNLAIFEELVDLFQRRTRIPGPDEFPKIVPRLESYDFPSTLFDSASLQHALRDDRLARIRASIVDTENPDSMIDYVAPWFGEPQLRRASVDMILSQAVLEHIDDLFDAYVACRQWLRQNGIMSHSIDFDCHGTADEWNGHWAHSDLTWKLLRGKQSWLLNRVPYSSHVAYIQQAGFDIVFDVRIKEKSNLSTRDLANQFRRMSEEDLNTRVVFLQAVARSSDLPAQLPGG